ncbi:MAG: hypothetical protein FJ031_00620 [Chloroflexi bacterium]|nr:hypothetical protein [Chloroflexota bacterium]
MTHEKKSALLSSTEVIALPPLKMVLVHAKDDRERMLAAVIESAEPREEQLQPQALKKLIAHLENNKSTIEERG